MQLQKKIIAFLKKHNKKSGGAMRIPHEEFSDALGPTVKRYLSRGLDIAVPAICEAISGHFIGDKNIGKVVGQHLRELMKEHIGLGFDWSELEKMPKLPDRGRPIVERPNYKRPIPRKGGARKMNSNLSNRNKVVKEIMKKHNLSLIEASKYVKNNNIKY